MTTDPSEPSETPRLVPVYYISNHIGEPTGGEWVTLCGRRVDWFYAFETRDAPSCKTCVRVARIHSLQVHRPPRNRTEPTAEDERLVIERVALALSQWSKPSAREVLVTTFRELRGLQKIGTW